MAYDNARDILMTLVNSNQEFCVEFFLKTNMPAAQAEVTDAGLELASIPCVESTHPGDNLAPPIPSSTVTHSR